jgi:hypothetical protein
MYLSMTASPDLLTRTRISALIPVGLIVESVTQLDDTILVTARAGIQMATCPLCASPSRRVQSRHVREVSDLPCSGRSVRPHLIPTQI